jgi:hypothetical protein
MVNMLWINQIIQKEYLLFGRTIGCYGIICQWRINFDKGEVGRKPKLLPSTYFIFEYDFRY